MKCVLYIHRRTRNRSNKTELYKYIRTLAEYIAKQKNHMGDSSFSTKM